MSFDVPLSPSCAMDLRREWHSFVAHGHTPSVGMYHKVWLVANEVLEKWLVVILACGSPVK